MYRKMEVSLSKDLRKKYGIRSFPVIMGDVVKVISGSRKGEGGKVAEVDHASGLVVVEGITIARADGKQKGFGIQPEKLQITHLDLSRGDRFDKIKSLAARKNIVVEKPEPEPEPRKEETAEAQEAKEEAVAEEKTEVDDNDKQN
ncbi:50S ribosomal protein L24 [Thermoplasma acidophilum]|uniref:Large ribosomal subunit protein uL24 n=1 Tax=Thermoplasma acidophilum (strain ATCC 25905 / DSM 1728 / JCM 9062 / NBRC 15155 / AMRC-C165) TaxID=273075 RepID=RL24_THEAC|nr:50S ribosomal protein L24 [Thermoplasma acidophilum]P60746.1 RecName: Full=Large ribosomal subunit protein uL24; AltName: Full=50S ribosomal protein L24 [Thermoplasma acidophilum DSM 1728]